MSDDIHWQILQGVALIAVAPALLGWLNWLKARGQGRKRRLRCVLQPYWDLGKLFRQPAVRPQTASWLFGAAPPIVLAAYTLLAFAIPVFYSPPLLQVDVIVVMYLLGLARFTLSLAGLDTGASFGGMGSSREMFLQFLTEVSLIPILAALALHWQTSDLVTIIQGHTLFRDMFQGPEVYYNVVLCLLPFSLAVLILLESGRIPVDNPDTHLELAMAQKAITLEYAGRDLAVVEGAEMIKLAFLFTLFGNLFLPFINPANWFDAGGWLKTVLTFVAFLIQMALLGWGMAQWELLQPKLRLRRVARLAGFSMLFSLITLALVLFTQISPGA